MKLFEVRATDSHGSVHTKESIETKKAQRRMIPVVLLGSTNLIEFSEFISIRRFYRATVSNKIIVNIQYHAEKIKE